MIHTPITSSDQALLSALNVAKSLERFLGDMIAEGVIEPDEDMEDAIADAKRIDEDGMAWLEANAPKCPSCRKAFAFQRQPRRPSHCSWCGYDHETGAVSVLVPATSMDAPPTI